MEKRFLGVRELADYLGIKVGTIYVWVCQKKISYIKVGRLVKFDLQKIDSWLKERTIKSVKYF